MARKEADLPEATFAEYEALMADRPQKFTAEQVDYQDLGSPEAPCCSCIHWFYSPARATSTCEIFRPDNDGSVPAWASCDFHTTDGIHYRKPKSADSTTDSSPST